MSEVILVFPGILNLILKFFKSKHLNLLI